MGTPNRKRKPDNTVAAMDRPAKGTQKRDPDTPTFKQLLQKQCPYHPTSKHSTDECLQLRNAQKNIPEPPHPKDRKGKEKDEDGNGGNDGY